MAPMAASASLFAFALLASSALASPIVSDLGNTNFLARRQSSTSVSTPLGTAKGFADGAGVRFAVSYGSAARWAESIVATSWQLPNNATDPSKMPLLCPQSSVDASEYAEDCLSAVLYVPSSVTSDSNAPTLLWIHGGSFNSGGLTNPGLDGMQLAQTTQSIVVVIQYRLSALGFMAPNGAMNLAVKDVVTSMKFLQIVLPSFGGGASKITLAGQSSGGNMIRALLAAPSASSLFQSAVIHSDPMDYGFLTGSVQSLLQNNFNSLLNCSSIDTACLNSMSLSDILNASDQQFGNAFTIDASATQSEPMRPVNDGTFITTTLNDQSDFPRVAKPILLSTVKNEAAATTYVAEPSFLSTSGYQQFVDWFYPQPKAQDLLASSFYSVPLLADGTAQDARVPLEQMGTDGIWRCAIWTFARSWAANGGKAFVGEYVLGSHYPFNDGVAFCQENSSVCHQDDIYIVFGTAPSPTSSQRALIAEVQARYKAFLHTGNPNPTSGGYATWDAATSTDIPALLLGGSGLVSAGACAIDFWGRKIPYDYQLWHD
ncbi:alpha beta-hydrolase [Vararia minispora EC-137]|uniref:Alpha beta-hydrolase n=1 Tax=Vararia minispora EC-137 TaxID=1314806 RepID=A0ACB8QN85_9AGAM|nr:alpha beta-hydrolase [Vararia minispora EC-137]